MKSRSGWPVKLILLVPAALSMASVRAEGQDYLLK